MKNKQPKVNANGRLLLKCPDHPKYKVIKKPIVDCNICRLMWAQKLFYLK